MGVDAATLEVEVEGSRIWGGRGRGEGGSEELERQSRAGSASERNVQVDAEDDRSMEVSNAVTTTTTSSGSNSHVVSHSGLSLVPSSECDTSADMDEGGGDSYDPSVERESSQAHAASAGGPGGGDAESGGWISRQSEGTRGGEADHDFAVVMSEEEGSEEHRRVRGGMGTGARGDGGTDEQSEYSGGCWEAMLGG